jgi:hypothetical protein
MTAQRRLNYQGSEHGLGNTVYVSGNFTTAGTSAPSVFSSGPFTVTRSGVGTLVVTLQENAVEFLAVHIGLEDATASSKRAYVVSKSVGSASAGASVTIETQSAAGTKADLTNPVVHFVIIYRKGVLRK